MMNKKRIKLNKIRKCGRVLIMVFAILLTVCLAAGTMLEPNAEQINNRLNTRTTVTTGGEYDAFLPDEEYLSADGSADTSALVAAHREMGIRLAEEGSVLLKNNGVLPLDTDSEGKVTVMGYRSTESYANYGMDIGSPEAEAQNVCFQDALEESGFSVNEAVCDAYNVVSATDTYAASSAKGINYLKGTGYYVTELGTDYRYTVAEPTVDEIRAQAGESTFNQSIQTYSDAVIVVIGRPTSEQSDFFPGSTGADPTLFTESPTKNVLSLSDNERALLQFAKDNFRKVIVLVNTSSAMEIDELEEDDEIDAVLWIGCPGNYGFIGVANILAGKANPSGQLTDTYAADSTSSPAMQNYGLYHYVNYRNESSFTGVVGTNNSLASSTYYADAYVIQAESIYTGYKYYETRYEDVVLGQGSASGSAGVSSAVSTSSGWKYADEVTYPFGYGLSYTTFEQKITNVTFAGDYKTATVTVEVKNTGGVDGKSVVQIYGQSPYTSYDKTYNVEKASVQLLAYDKVEVAADETVSVDVEVDMQYLASYDETNAKTYIMESDGTYYFSLGSNKTDHSTGAHAAINNILAAKGKTVSDGMDVDGDASAAYAFTWSSDKEALFSVSKAGVSITNQLDDADYNYFESGTVTYLSRQNWQGTWPKEYSSEILADDEMVDDYLANATYDIHTDDDVSGVTFNATYSEEEDVNFPDLFGCDFDDENWDKLLDKVSIDEAVRFTCCGNRSFSAIDSISFVGGGFSYTENGSVGIQKTLSNQSDENAPWYVSTSDENATYSCNSFGSAPLMASTWNQDLLNEMGELWGNDALFVNIPMVWAPSLNTHRTPYNGRNGEYYSEDGVLSGYSALAVGSGALSKGLITSIKHFAFNTQETARNGISEFMTEQTARETELRGFQIALEGTYDESGNRTAVLGIMTAYNRIGARYVGAHEGLMQGILRGEWDFNGYATSDLVVSSSNYMTYAESMLAGTTNFDASINSTNDSTVWRTFGKVDDLTAAVSGDAELLASIKENMHYALWTFSQSNLANWMTSETQVIWVWNWWRVAYIGGAIFSGACIACGVVLYVYSAGLHKIGKKKKLNQTKREGGETK